LGKINFFYGHRSVYEVSLRALERRRFKVLETDPDKGIIRARLNRGILKPEIAMDIQITQVTEQQTSVDINSHCTKSWLSPGNTEATAERKFIYTLYRCFDKI
jgi:hypothetical protein